MMIVMSVHHHHQHHHHGAHHGAHHCHLLRHRPYLFYLRFKCAFRPGLRCRRCVDMIIMTTAGDAENASS